MTPESRVFAEARRLGFVASGIAAAAPSLSHDAYTRWLGDGNNATMDYLRRHLEMKRNPSALLPECRSVIAVAVRYPVNPEPSTGFAMHVRGCDYHVVIRSMLRALAQVVARETSATTSRICVDSAPLLEREWASRAGIGWRGRQGQIVHPEFGSCILLGFLLVDAVLAPSTPIRDGCGDCRKCVESCPTGAILEDGTLDCRRCISYYTVEHRGPVPSNIASAMGGSLFGCDRCTAVCPKNKAGEQFVPLDMLPRRMPSAQECAQMTVDEFDRTFRGTAVHRSKLDRLVRNARICLANCKSVKRTGASAT